MLTFCHNFFNFLGIMNIKITSILTLLILVLFEPTATYAFLPPSMPGGNVMDQIQMKKRQQKKNKGKSPFKPVKSLSSGIAVSLPDGWKKLSEDENSVNYVGPASHGVSISFIKNDYGKKFPTKASLEAYLDTAKKEKESGIITHYEEKILGGVGGVLRVESPASSPEDPRRITWIGYNGSVGINIVASSQNQYFDQHQSELLQVLETVQFTI